MPSVIEIEETLVEIRELPSYESRQPVSAPRCGFVSRIIAVLKGLTARRRERSYEDRECYGASEMPLDILAREHPYVYIKALAG